MDDKIIDNFEIEEVLAKLEGLDDEELAVQLLREFNEASSQYGQLLMNRDPGMDHEDWKNNCDEAQARLRQILQKIKNL